MRKRERRQLKILAADSNVSTLNIIEYILTKAGHQVLACSSAADAVGFLEGNDLDIIITNMKIHNDSGLDLVEYVQTNFKVAVIIMVDGHASTEGVVKAIKMGADECLVKPFTKKELTATVRRTVGKLARNR